jgi:hypothetical protein
MVKFSNRSSGAKSKRVPLRLKHKVETRVKEHNKKMKKEARKMKALGIIRKSKKKNKKKNLKKLFFKKYFFFYKIIKFKFSNIYVKFFYKEKKTDIDIPNLFPLKA